MIRKVLICANKTDLIPVICELKNNPSTMKGVNVLCPVNHTSPISNKKLKICFPFWVRSEGHWLKFLSHAIHFPFFRLSNSFAYRSPTSSCKVCSPLKGILWCTYSLETGIIIILCFCGSSGSDGYCCMPLYNMFLSFSSSLFESMHARIVCLREIYCILLGYRMDMSRTTTSFSCRAPYIVLFHFLNGTVD